VGAQRRAQVAEGALHLAEVVVERDKRDKIARTGGQLLDQALR
jgi:hypothetical protein